MYFTPLIACDHMTSLQAKFLLEKLPHHSDQPAIRMDFIQALNGPGGLKPVEPALDMIAGDNTPHQDSPCAYA